MAKNMQIKSPIIEGKEVFEVLGNPMERPSVVTVTDYRTDEIVADITEAAYWDDEHFKSLKNKQETFNFTTFGDAEFSEYLARRNRLVIPDEDGKMIEFIILNTRKYHNADGVNLQVFSSASYITLKKAKVIQPFSSNAMSAEAHASSALANTEWEIGTVDFKGNRSISFDSHTNPYSYLKRVASTFDLELHFRVETDGNQVTRRYVDLVEFIGEWQGKEAVFGKDIEEIKRNEDTSNIVTALTGIGPENEEGERVEVRVEDKEALERWGRKHNGKLQHIEDTHEIQTNDTEITEARVKQLTENELEKRINAFIEYEANIIDLENVLGLEHERVRFGDIIRIKDLKFNPPIYLEARVHSQRRSIKYKGRKTVTLGDYTEFSEEEVMEIWRSLQREIRRKIDRGTLEEVTYTKTEIDQKDEPGQQAHDKIDRDIGWVEVIESEEGAQEKADQAQDNAEDNAKQYTDEYAVAQEIYNDTVADIKEDLNNAFDRISEKAELEYVNGQLLLKADNSLVQAINDTVNDLEGISVDLQDTTDRLQDATDGLLSDVADHADTLSDQGGRITTVETDLDTVEGNLSVAINDLSTLDGVVESHGTQISANSEAISLKAEQSTVEGLQDEFDNLQVGGRNLKENSEDIEDNFSTHRGSKANYEKVNMIEEWGFSNAYRVRITGGTNQHKLITRVDGMVHNQDYTYSIYLKNESEKTIRVYMQGARTDKNQFQIIQPNESRRVSYTFQRRDEYDWSQFIIQAYPWEDESDNYELNLILGREKFEKGNRATDWTPAPEDIDADISAIDGKVETVSGNLSVLAGEVELKAERSALETVEGDVSTLSDEVGTLSVAYDGIEASVSSLEETTDGHTSDISDMSAEIEAVAGEISLKADQTTVKGLQDDFNNLEIGGRNLLGGTGFNEIPESRSSSLTIIEGNPNSLFVENTSNTTTGFITDRITEIKKGQVYTLSIEVKTDNTKTLDYNYIMHYEEGNWSGVPSIDLIQDGEWHEYTVTFTSTVNRTNAGLLIAADYRDNPGESYEVRKLMMVEGNKIGSWQPAPEDNQKQFDTITENVSQLTVSVEGIETEVSTLTQDVSDHGSEISDISSSVKQHADMIEDRVTKTEYSIDMDGVITDLEDHESRITQTEDSIESKVEVTEFNNITGDLDNRVSTVEQTADGLVSDVSTIEGQIDTLDIKDFGNMKQFNDVASFYRGDSDATGILAIRTKINTRSMVRMSISGYSNEESESNIELTVSFYNYTDQNRIMRTSFNSTGTKEVENVRLALDENNNIVLLLGNNDSIWRYLQLFVDKVEFSFRIPPNSVREDWNLEFLSSIPDSWSSVVNVDGKDYSAITESHNTRIEQNATNISTKAESKVVDDIEGRVSSAETNIDGLEGAITSKVEVTTFNRLEGRVDDAESTISQHANQIQSKVEENDVRSIFTQEADSFTFDASQINFDGHVFGENATFEGDIEGGRILSNSSIDVTTDLYVGNNIYLGESNNNSKTIRFNQGVYITSDGTVADEIRVGATAFNFGSYYGIYGGIKQTYGYESSPTLSFSTDSNNYESDIVLDRLSGDLQFHGDEFDFKGNVTARQYYSNTGYFKRDDSNSIQITSSNIRLISGGELKQAFGSIPKVRLDPSGDGIVDDKTFGANNPASMQPVLTDYIVVDLKGKTEIILNTDFLNFVSDYYVFASKDVDIIEQKEGSILVDGNGKHMIQVVGIQKGKEDVAGYRIVDKEEKVQTMGLMSASSNNNKSFNREFKAKLREEVIK